MISWFWSDRTLLDFEEPLQCGHRLRIEPIGSGLEHQLDSPGARDAGVARPLDGEFAELISNRDRASHGVNLVLGEILRVSEARAVFMMLIGDEDVFPHFEPRGAGYAFRVQGRSQ